MDEPFSGLDIKAINKVVNVIKKLSYSNEKLTILIVSHDLKNALSVSDKVFVLAKESDKEGATIIKKYHLIEENIAWIENNTQLPRFNEIIHEIENLL